MDPVRPFTRCLSLIVATTLVATSCADSSEPSTAAVAAEAATSTVVSTTDAPDTTATEPPTAAAAVETTAPPTVSTFPATTTTAIIPTTTAAPTYSAVVSEITPEIEARMTASWREGCPVGLDELAHIELTHWNFDEKPVTGELIVAAHHAEGVVQVFEKLFEARFLIERMELVDVYEGDDDLSMAANNTSAFNCREVAWRPGVWSRHAFGRAIDINPLMNPYVSATRLLPPEGAEFVDRTLGVPGMILAEDVVVQAFAEIGWTWGGYWQSAKDYQHFDVAS